MYLKWENTIVGELDEEFNLTLEGEPNLEPVKLNFPRNLIPRLDVIKFLEERIPSRGRRDIESLLQKKGLLYYDIIDIAKTTRAFNIMDRFWLSNSIEEDYQESFSLIFGDMFQATNSITGSPVHSPGGVNVKRYGVLEGKAGIIKRRLSPTVNDTEMEVVVYRLGKLLNIKCCPAVMINGDEVFSEFLYDYNKEYITHVRRYFEGKERTSNLYEDLISILPSYKEDIQKMLVIDFITRQDDRHLSNFAIKNNNEFYPLYDNGRSLFYEDTEETVHKSIEDIDNWSTSFGEVGTYYDHLVDIGDRTHLNLNLDLKLEDIVSCFKGIEMPLYRKDGAIQWILGTLEMLKEGLLHK